MAKKKKRKRATLSVCMIVKNEERMLPRCLQSIKNIADEIIVVDTGSTDRTMEIARSFGARVYEHPWQKDFSLHRNQSISYATGDWILQIDADEELDPGSEEVLRNAIANAPERLAGYAVSIRDFDRQGQVRLVFHYPRLYRNRIGVYYQGIVHNQVVLPGPSAISSIVLNHYGYDLDRKTMLRKFKRSIALLRKLVREDPGNPTPLFYLTNTYSMYHRHAKVIEYAEKTIALLRQQEAVSPHFLSVYFPYINSLAGLNRFEEAIAAAREALQIKNDYIDAYYKLARLYYICQEFEQAVAAGLQYLRLQQRFSRRPALLDNLNVYTLHMAHRVKYWLGASLVHRGRVEEGVQYIHEALDCPLPEHAYTIEAIHNVLAAQEQGAAREIAGHAYKRYRDDTCFLYLLAQELANVDMLGWMTTCMRQNPPALADVRPTDEVATIMRMLRPGHSPGRSNNPLLLANYGKDTVERISSFVLENNDKNQPIVRSENWHDAVMFLVRTALAIGHEDVTEADLQQARTPSDLPEELALMQGLLQLYAGMRYGDLNQLVQGIEQTADRLSMPKPEELQDVGQLLQFLVDAALLADRHLWPDAGNLALAIANCFFGNDVRLQAIMLQRQIRRAERDADVQPVMRLFFRYMLPLRQNWLHVSNSAEIRQQRRDRTSADANEGLQRESPALMSATTEIDK